MFISSLNAVMYVFQSETYMCLQSFDPMYMYTVILVCLYLFVAGLHWI